jgi:hypothetical protein
MRGIVDALRDSVDETYIKPLLKLLPKESLLVSATLGHHRACLSWRGRLLLSKPLTSDFSDSFFRRRADEDIDGRVTVVRAQATILDACVAGWDYRQSGWVWM